MDDKTQSNKRQYDRTAKKHDSEPIPVGSTVHVFNTTSKPSKWSVGLVLARLNRSYTVELESGQTVNRNRCDIRLSQVPFIPQKPLDKPVVTGKEKMKTVTKPSKAKSVSFASDSKQHDGKIHPKEHNQCLNQ